MKHCAFSKMLVIATVVALTAACQKHPEIEFAGTVTGIRPCSESYLDNNVGYIVKLDYPDSIGGTLTTDDGTTTGLIVLYEPDRLIRVDDHIRGSFYLDDKYSRANCALHYSEIDLPEGVFTQVRVD